jgi:hypothetical protein
LVTLVACAVNYNYQSAKHTDPDASYGLALITCFGDFYSGGELFLSDLGYGLKIIPGDFVLLKSSQVQHEVLSYEGVRHSLVLFADQNL